MRIDNCVRDRVCIKNHRRDRYMSSSIAPFSTYPPSLPCEEPIQIAVASCAPARGITFTPEGCCYCKGQGHSIKQYPKLKEPGSLTKRCATKSRTLLSGTLSWLQQQLRVDAFVDSGAVERRFIDAQRAKMHHIPTLHLTQSLTVTALDSLPLGSGTISEITEPLSMHIPFENHTEDTESTIPFFSRPVYPLVLGHTWLVQHNPHIKWGEEGRTKLQ